MATRVARSKRDIENRVGKVKLASGRIRIPSSIGTCYNSIEFAILRFQISWRYHSKDLACTLTKYHHRTKPPSM